MLPAPMPGDFMSNYSHPNQDLQQQIDDSDPDELEDGVGESEPESEADEDLPLEMDESRNSNKVSFSDIHHLGRSANVECFLTHPTNCRKTTLKVRI